MPETQEALLQLWQGQIGAPLSKTDFDSRGILFVCGGEFVGLEEHIAHSGRNPDQPVTAEALVAAGARLKWVNELTAIALAFPLDEATWTRVVGWVDFGREEYRSAEAGFTPDVGG